jgi:hypothetical protein
MCHGLWIETVNANAVNIAHDQGLAVQHSTAEEQVVTDIEQLC